MGTSVDVSIHLAKDERRFEMHESLFGAVCLQISDYVTIFCTPEQAFDIAESINRDTKKILKERERQNETV